jgi:hypothetical protein
VGHSSAASIWNLKIGLCRQKSVGKRNERIFPGSTDLSWELSRVCSFAQTAKTTSKAKVGQVDVTKVRVTLGVALFEGTFAETGDALDVGPASGNRRQSKRWRELSSMVIDEGANCRVVRQQGPKDSAVGKELSLKVGELGVGGRRGGAVVLMVVEVVEGFVAPIELVLSMLLFFVKRRRSVSLRWSWLKP